MYRFWLFVHIAGLLGFVGAHGVSAAVGLALRRERDPGRIRAMLKLSAATRVPMYASLALLLTGGIVNGFLGHWWGQGWIWIALGLFVAMAATLVGLAMSYYRRVRACLERRDVADSELDRLLSSPVPVTILLVGGVGLLTILWLMIYKPS